MDTYVEKEKATEKAKDLVRMGVERSKLLEPLQASEVPVVDKALVIGAGVAGMQAALDLADMGFQVYLVEKEPSIGGRMARFDKVFPTNDCSICILGPKMVEVARNKNIKIMSYSEVKAVDGYVGNFNVKVEHKPRYLDVANVLAAPSAVKYALLKCHMISMKDLAHVRPYMCRSHRLYRCVLFLIKRIVLTARHAPRHARAAP